MLETEDLGKKCDRNKSGLIFTISFKEIAGESFLVINLNYYTLKLHQDCIPFSAFSSSKLEHPSTFSTKIFDCF